MRTLHVLMGFRVLAGFPNPASSATITVDAEQDLVPVKSLLSGANLHANGESGEPIKALIRDGADPRGGVHHGRADTQLPVPGTVRRGD